MRPEGVDDTFVRGEPGEGKILVTTRRDRRGNVTEQVWTTPDASADWDNKNWKESWE